MTLQEINDLLYRFNIEGGKDMSIFNGVPEDLVHLVMYPHVMRIALSDEEYEVLLKRLFKQST